MSFSAPTFAAGDTDYIAKLNTAFASLATILGGLGAVPYLTNLHRGLFGTSARFFDESGLVASISGTDVDVTAGKAWIPGQSGVLDRSVADSIDASALADGTWYITLDGVGNLHTGLAAEIAAADRLWSFDVASGTPSNVTKIAGDAFNLLEPLSVGHGGTGATSLGAGAIVVGNGTSAVATVAAVATGSVLVSNGLSTAPVYSASPTLTGLTLSGLTASRLVATNGSKALVSTITAANLLASVSGTTGTGDLVFAAAPTLTGEVNVGSWRFQGTGGHLSSAASVKLGVGLGVGTAPAVGLHVLSTDGIMYCYDVDTDATTKAARWGLRHYTNATAPFLMLIGASTSSVNGMDLGGGSALGTAATQIRIFTAANNTTTTGTARWQWGSAGHLSSASGVFLGVGVGVTTAPAYLTEFANSGTASQIHVAPSSSNEGGYITTAGAGGVAFGTYSMDSSNWTARHTTGGRFAIAAGVHTWYSDTGLVAGNTFTPTERMQLSAAGALSVTASVTSQLLIGGTGAASTLALRATSGAGVGSEVVIVQLGSNGAYEAGRFSQTGLGIGGVTAAYRFDAQGQVLRFGSDTTSENARTDATNKTFRFICPHYTNSEEPAFAMGMTSANGANTLYIGGGLSASFNAATTINLACGANGITTTGTVVLALTTTAITVSDAVNFVFNTGTGTKFATATTQKMGWWNATPAAQPAAVTDAAGGATVDAEARTAINTLLARLRTVGLIAT